jgi:hypothetical protein
MTIEIEDTWSNKYADQFTGCFCRSCEAEVLGYILHSSKRSEELNLMLAKAIYDQCERTQYVQQIF